MMGLGIFATVSSVLQRTDPRLALLTCGLDSKYDIRLQQVRNKYGERSRMEESSSTPNFQPLRILWTAFLGAVCVYIVIAYALGQGRLASSDLTFMVPILAGAAV